MNTCKLLSDRSKENSDRRIWAVAKTHTDRNIGLIKQHSRLDKLTSWDARGDLWKRLFGDVLTGFQSTMCNILICVVTTGRRRSLTWNESGLLLQRSVGRSGRFALQQQEAGMIRSEQETRQSKPLQPERNVHTQLTVSFCSPDEAPTFINHMI